MWNTISSGATDLLNFGIISALNLHIKIKWNYLFWEGEKVDMWYLKVQNEPYAKKWEPAITSAGDRSKIWDESHTHRQTHTKYYVHI